MSSETSRGLAVSIKREAPVPLDVDFHVGRGSLMALLGPSGSGKTSTLRAIAGLLKPGSGVVSCDGVPWFDGARGINLSPQQRRVGLVFQDYALFPHLSAHDNIAIAVPAADAAKQSQIVERLLGQMRLLKLAGRRPRELSGGERQRVAIARALARDPQVLLLDEPFSAVDRTTRDALKFELVELRSRLEIPIILVTHDLAEALTLADVMSVMMDGKLVQSGAPQQIREQPKTAAVARLLGVSNVFHATLFASARTTEPGLLYWGRIPLNVSDTGTFAGGEKVTWMIGSESIELYPDGVEPDPKRTVSNAVPCRIAAINWLGDVVTVGLLPKDGSADALQLTLTTQALNLLRLKHDQNVVVVLPPEQIKVMPGEASSQSLTKRA